MVINENPAPLRIAAVVMVVSTMIEVVHMITENARQDSTGLAAAANVYSTWSMGSTVFLISIQCLILLGSLIAAYNANRAYGWRIFKQFGRGASSIDLFDAHMLLMRCRSHLRFDICLLFMATIVGSQMVIPPSTPTRPSHWATISILPAIHSFRRPELYSSHLRPSIYCKRP